MRAARHAILGTLSPAVLLAGLLLCAPLGAAEAAPPGRSVAPSQDAAEAGAWREKIEAGLKAQDDRLEALGARLDAQSAALSGSARSADKALKEEAQAIELLQGSRQKADASLELQRQRLDAAEAKTQALDADASKARAASSLRDARLDAMTKDLAALKQDLSDSHDSLAAGLKQIEANRSDLQARSAKLESLSELLAAMKKDIDSNNEELVEAKQSLKRLEAAAVTPAADSNAAWWDAVLGWKYLPAVATGLGAAALGVAALHH